MTRANFVSQVMFPLGMWSRAGQLFLAIQTSLALAGTPTTYPASAPKSGPLESKIRSLGIAYPPKRLTLIALKQERVLEVWVANGTGIFKKAKEYEFTAASGVLGPKRRQGDRQVPEGFYGLPVLNPRSKYHRSIRVDYPNATDRRNSKLRGADLGGDIYVHGNAVSIGCIAIGDEPIEELFELAKLVKPASRKIIISPVDFRRSPNFKLEGEEAWVHRLHQSIAKKLREFRD